MNRRMLRCFWPAAVVLAVAFALLHPAGDWARSVIERTARSGGAKTMLSSQVFFVGPNGPFFGEGASVRFWNFAWTHVRWAVPTFGALGAATCTFALCSGRLGHFATFSPRGPTRCGRCGYALSGLREPVCPECGTRI
ncbi:MAG: hypothetical protein ACOYN0_12515 [Phycisphaerales bacterium]